MASPWCQYHLLPGHSDDLNNRQDDRKMATFAQYAMACAQEALGDAEWHPTSPEDLEATVSYPSVHSTLLTDEVRVSILALASAR